MTATASQHTASAQTAHSADSANSTKPAKPVEQQSSFKIYVRLLGYVRRYWVTFLLGVLGTIVLSGTDAGFTWLLKPILDQGFIAKNQHFIHWLPGIILIAFVVRGIAGFVSNYYMTRVGRNVVMQFRQIIFSHLLHLPAQFFDNTSAGQLLSALIYNVEQVTRACTDALVTIVQETCLIGGLLTVMWLTSWRMTLLFLLIAPLIALTARYSSKRMRKLSKHVQNSMGEITQIAEESIEGYKVIRTFGGEAYENGKFVKATLRNRFRELKVTATNSLATAAVQQVAGCAVAITIFLATSNKSHITAGGFVSMLTAMLAILKPMRTLTTISSVIQRGIAGAESIFALLDEPAECDNGTKRLIRAQGAIEYRHVNFQYPKSERPVLQDINFTVEPGKILALVGRSGSGKSTLVNLLPRFYDAFRGEITIDGHDIRSLELANLRSQFALVSQHVTLFNDTIANNIAYGQFATTSEADIIKAAEAAHAMEFIRDLPNGLHSMIGDNGVLLSGGQRQRLAIARALLKNAPILILDEATSALDTEAERHIQEALTKLMYNRTTLVIAHRLSTIESADHILVLDAGRIVERGTHKELLTLNGHYAKLYRMQFEHMKPKEI